MSDDVTLTEAEREAIAWAVNKGYAGSIMDTTQRIVTARVQAARAGVWTEAAAIVERQTDLTELVHFDRPSDFRKGVLTCLTALRAAHPEQVASDE